MTIGYSDGKAYESEMDEVLDKPLTFEDRAAPITKDIKAGVTDPVGSNYTDFKGVAGALEKPADAFKLSGRYPGSSEVDRDHHVPLVASALTDKDNNMYGMAIDHRIDPKPEFEKFLWDHEAYENEYMNHLVNIGYSSQDAYHKAHDWSTQRESSAVEAAFGKEGLENYKQHWRDAASIASEPSDKERHPDAHTTKHGLDESELGQSFGDKLMHARESFTGVQQPTKEDIAAGKVPAKNFFLSGVKDAVGMGMQAGGAEALFMGPAAKTFNLEAATEAHGMYKSGKDMGNIWTKTGTHIGADGKLRQEIPDVDSKLNEKAFTKTIVPDEHTWDKVGGLDSYDLVKPKYLPQILHHPELFKAYPELKDIVVRPIPPEKSGTSKAYYDRQGSIYLDTHTSLPDIKSSVLHEVQHVIQDMEGFDSGSNVKAMRYLLDTHAPEISDKLSEEQKKSAAYEAYQRITGEVESRNVQRRANMKDLERYLRPPNTTADVPLDKQIRPPR